MTRLLEQHREAILRIAAKYGAHNVRVFGSTARGEASDGSDVDILVDLADDRSLLDQVGLQQELEEVLGRKVDVVVEGGISPYLEKRILAEAVPL
jgi:predicted nucleotidyltransferase